MGHIVDLASYCGIKAVLGCALVMLLREGISILPREPRGLEQIGFDPLVVKLRLSFLLWLAHCNFAGRDNPAGLTCGIVQITGNNRLGRTDNHAGWFQVVFYAVGTEIAFGGGVGVGIYVE